ncbi:uncharacterized protein LOC114517134 [Dendronephthya gigantea]|uniref:uncharacterized protein LOC114517134 n=1 Tax=Dendronephthya gigantea TaxID=151771 RepID=UPI00106D3213|nr:uncharacterized protein LOC114517134 [Dendronephthya gigantea]
MISPFRALERRRLHEHMREYIISFATMRNGRKVAILIFLSSFVLPRSTVGEKAEDCVKEKQYWSKSALNPNGACVRCPPYWQNCNKEAGGDKDRCIKSCRVKPKTKPKTKPNKMTSTTPSYNDIRSTTTSVQSQPQPTSTRILHSTSSTILAFSSQIYRGKPNDKSGHDKPGKIIAIAVPLTVVFLLVLFAALVRLIQSHRKRAEKERLRRVGIEEDGRSQNALPIQDTRLDLRRGGTQETEKDDMQDIK